VGVGGGGGCVVVRGDKPSKAVSSGFPEGRRNRGVVPVPHDEGGNEERLGGG